MNIILFCQSFFLSGNLGQEFQHQSQTEIDRESFAVAPSHIVISVYLCLALVLNMFQEFTDRQNKK